MCLAKSGYVPVNSNRLTKFSEILEKTRWLEKNNKKK